MLRQDKGKAREERKQLTSKRLVTEGTRLVTRGRMARKDKGCIGN